MTIIQSPYLGIKLPQPDTIFRHYLPAQARFPEYPAFIDGLTGRTITSTQLRIDALRLGLGIRNLLQRRLHQSGEKQVALIFSPNSIDFPQIFYGCQSVKIITSLANASYTYREVAHQIRDGRPSISFVHPTLYETYKQAEDLLRTEGHTLPAVYWAVPGSATSPIPGKSVLSYEHLMMDHAEIKGFEGTRADVDEAYDTALLCYSSGTVSLPHVWGGMN
jgi:4-coumarate--CoA ligase